MILYLYYTCFAGGREDGETNFYSFLSFRAEARSRGNALSAWLHFPARRSIMKALRRGHSRTDRQTAGNQKKQKPIKMSNERTKSSMKKLLQLALTFLKIGAFTFGGGYAMIALLENEFVTKKKWLEQNEFIDMVAISESTPGPIAINSATYIGYRVGGLPGAVTATLSVSLPSFIIIYIISLFLDRFLALSWVAYAFHGIRVCVIWLILSAGVKMLKSLEKTVFNYAILISVSLLLVTLSVLAVSFSSVWPILFCGMIGVAVWMATRQKNTPVKTAEDSPTGTDFPEDGKDSIAAKAAGSESSTADGAAVPAESGNGNADGAPEDTVPAAQPADGTDEAQKAKAKITGETPAAENENPDKETDPAAKSDVKASVNTGSAGTATAAGKEADR